MTIPAADGTPALDAPGRLVAGRYRLSRVIASGGMGQVWRGFDERSERPVAVKVLRPEFAAEPAFTERFRAEARTAALLDHPNVATVIDYGEQTGPHGEPTGAYLVMELVVGEPLSTIIRRQGPMPIDRALALLAQAGAGLQAAHDAGVVHRDVKPANLLVTRDDIVKITDFGISRAAGALALTKTGMVLGTAHYLSPEQVQGRSASPASDLYALGVVGFECLAGRRPYEADSPLEVALAHQRDPVPELPPRVPRHVAALITRALAKDPADRHDSAGAFGRAAAAARSGAASAATSTPVPAALAARTTTAASAGAAAVPAAARPTPAAVPAPTSASTHATPRPAVRRHPRRTVRLPLLALGGLLLAALVIALLGGHSSHHAAPPSSAHATVTGAGIAVNPLAYTGKPAKEVLAALRTRGLEPTEQLVSVGGTPGTVVTIVASDGAPLPASLAKGTAVTVRVVS